MSEHYLFIIYIVRLKLGESEIGQRIIYMPSANSALSDDVFNSPSTFKFLDELKSIMKVYFRLKSKRYVW